MKYLEGTKILCLEYNEYVCEGMYSPEFFRQQKHREEIKVHGSGSDALIEYEELPHKYKTKVKSKYDDPYEYASREPLLKLITIDEEARQFYADYELPTGEPLDINLQRDYGRQCDYLNLINDVLRDKKAFKQLLNTTVTSIWQNIILIANADKINHSLPKSEKRLRQKHKKYGNKNYISIIQAWRYGNNYARIVTPKIENLLMAIYAKRYGRATLVDVVKDYNSFIGGSLKLVDLDSGEIFNRNDFIVKNGLYELAPATVSYYANMKHNRERIDLLKLGYNDYVQKHKPHNRRIAPKYAFSTISMDDYLPPFKTLDGKRTVWMYCIFDVASKAIVGVSFGVKKNHELVNEALRDMLRLCAKMNWGIPMEIELERSLNYERRGSEDEPDIFTQGNVFPFVRFTKGGNSQEKMAEAFLKLYKYEQLAGEKGFLGRPHGRDENFKLNRDKKEARYLVNELIARLKRYIDKYNNSPRSENDCTTRWQYLCKNQNPQAINNKLETIIPYIGFKTATSIHRRIAQVQNDWYKVPNDLTWAHDTGGRVQVDAYWIAAADGAAPEHVYLYHKGELICKALRQEAYQYSQAERTGRDWEIFHRQSTEQKTFEQNAYERLAEIPRVDNLSNDELPGDAVKYVDVSYDKLAQEEEEYAEMMAEKEENQPDNTAKKFQKMHKNTVKQGGYMQNFDSENIINNAISML